MMDGGMLDQFVSLRGGLILFLTGLGVFLTLRNPKFGIMAFIVLFFSRGGFLIDIFPAAYEILHLPKMFGILTLISWFIHSKKYPLRLPFEFWLMVLFFLVICLSRYVAGTPIFGHKVVAEFLKMCVLFFLIVNVVRTKEDLTQIIWVLIIANVTLVLYHYYLYKTVWYSIFKVVNYQDLDRNGFAATIVSMCPLAYIFFRKEEGDKFTKLLLGFCLISFICGIILTYSRGGAVALGATLFMLILQDKKKTKPIILFLIIGSLIGARLSENYVTQVKSIRNYAEDPSAAGRVATNYAAINMLKTHPLIGVGAGNFNDRFLEYTPEHLEQYVSAGKSIHNIFLQVASETGFVGLFIFSLLIMKWFIDVVKLRKSWLQHKFFESFGHIPTALGIALFGYFVACQFLPSAYTSHVYVFLPLIVSAIQMVRWQEVSS